MTELVNSSFARATEAISYLRGKGIPKDLSNPSLAVICGSGLGGLADAVQEGTKLEFDFDDIPYFPSSTVEGHAGKLVFGFLNPRIPAVLMKGRLHYYEGHSFEEITFAIRLFKLLGVGTIIVTCAAGGLNPAYAVGDIVVLNDHLFMAGLSGIHPLRGPNADEFGPRFPPLSDAYDLELRRTAHRAWKKTRGEGSKRRIHEGVYAFVGGPSYETRAECRMLRMLGADLVGMSTAPEVVVARHCGMRVLAISLVTNNAVLDAGPRGDDALIESADREELDRIIAEGRANHEEVLEEGRQAALDFEILVGQTIEDLNTSEP